MGEKVNIKMTDNAGHIWIGGRFYKLVKYISSNRLKGTHTAEYIEVKPSEYDERVERLTLLLASYPNVDLVDVIRDALYDMPLQLLDRFEKRLEREVSKAKEKGREPDVETKRGERGTCVELHIGRKYAMQLRI